MHLIALPLPQPARAATPVGPGPRLPSPPALDATVERLPLSTLAGRQVVIEEAFDGADADLSFDARGELRLGSKGRPLAGGFGERPFIPLKIWALAHEHRLMERLGDRLVLHGAWTYAMRRCWYDRLPHYFIATELVDRESGRCLSTARRQALLDGSPVMSAPALYMGPMPTHPQWLEPLMRASLATSADWRRAFEAAAIRESLPAALWQRRADRGGPAAGLIVKVEDDRHVLARYRLVQTPDEGGIPLPSLLPNALAGGADLFAAQPTVSWRDLGLKTLRSLGALRGLSAGAVERRCA